MERERRLLIVVPLIINEPQRKCQNFSQKICFTATKHSGAKNGRFDPSTNPRPMKNRAAKDEELHTDPTFVHVFCSNFATFRVSVSTPNFQKSTPNFQKALSQQADNQPFSKPSKNGFFFAQKFFREEFSKYGGQKWLFCQDCSKKKMDLPIRRPSTYSTWPTCC